MLAFSKPGGEIPARSGLVGRLTAQDGSPGRKLIFSLDVKSSIGRQVSWSKKGRLSGFRSHPDACLHAFMTYAGGRLPGSSRVWLIGLPCTMDHLPFLGVCPCEK